MEQRFPRIGMAALAVSTTQFLGVLLNGLLGWFPAGIIGQGARGQKFHILQYIRQSLDLPYKQNGFWSDAGPLTGQEYAMILLMLVTLGIGLIGIRRRPDISGPDSMSSDDQRSRLDEQAVSVGRPGGLSVINPTTASIVESVLGKSEVPTVQVISDALGEMTAVAIEMGVDEELIKGKIIEVSDEDESTLDSRFTVTVDDEDDLDVIDLTDSKPAEIVEPVSEVADTSSSGDDYSNDWLDDDDWLDDSPAATPAASATATPAASATATPAASATATRPARPEPVTVISTPETPAALEASSSYLLPSSPRDAASGSMPVRPQTLPDKAEYDIQQACWTLFGRPIKFTEAPPPPPTAEPAPAAEPALVVVAPTQTPQTETVAASTVPASSTSTNQRRLPTVPKPPPKKSGRALPALPTVPRR